MSFNKPVAAAFVAAVGWAFRLTATPLYSTTVVSDPMSASTTYWTGGYQDAPALADPYSFSPESGSPLSFVIPNVPHSPGAWLELDFWLLAEPGFAGPWASSLKAAILPSPNPLSLFSASR